MRLLELASRGFRNLCADTVSFGPGVNVVLGENGQGKTNLLEAVALLCGQRSFRRAKPAEMAADGESFRVEGSLRRGFATEDLAVEWSAGTGRRFRRAGKEISFRGASALAPAVFLAPEHRSILAGPPEERRRFLDRLVAGWRPAAGADLVAYERALKERNALLSSLREGRSWSSNAPGELDAWTEELATAGEAVRRHRRAALDVWREAFFSLLGSAGKEYSEVTLSYSCGEASDLRTTLKKLLPIERARGRSLAGPHRDDLVWSRGGRPLEGRASAGEIHRLLTLAKVAEWRVVRDAAGEAPLFGVDDFDAGLSARSLASFLAGLPEATTVVLTSASDPARFRGLAASVLQMEGGRCVGEGARAASGV
ncbi:MAG TPA: DNA replication and repair protein RecF [Thermoanaerobaculia bacterium]|nr:DNA replication and repair protein RecF [Thermoanaerobaculia bacterium]